MTKLTSGYAQLIGLRHAAETRARHTTWLNELAQQLDDTLELVQAELNGDFELLIDHSSESPESDRLRITSFPIEEYDWQTVVAS